MTPVQFGCIITYFSSSFLVGKNTAQDRPCPPTGVSSLSLTSTCTTLALTPRNAFLDMNRVADSTRFTYKRPPSCFNNCQYSCHIAQVVEHEKILWRNQAGRLHWNMLCLLLPVLTLTMSFY